MSRCPVCNGVEATGPTCLVEDSDCWEWTGTGTDDDPYIAEPIIAVDADQLLVCSVDGLLAEPPAAISNPPSAHAYHSANQTIANNTLTAVALNVESYDTDTMHSESVSNSRITFTTAGLYVIEFHAAWDKHLTGNRRAVIRKNGSDILAQDTKLTSDGLNWIIGHNLIAQDEFIATDYVEGMVQQTSGGNLILLVESYSPALTATKI